MTKPRRGSVAAGARAAGPRLAIRRLRSGREWCWRVYLLEATASGTSTKVRRGADGQIMNFTSESAARNYILVIEDAREEAFPE